MELLHIVNRGVDRRDIVLDDHDRWRFIHDMFEFNDQEKVFNTSYFFNQQSNDIGYQYIGSQQKSARTERRIRKLIVNIHAFCLMNNHYHMLVSPTVTNGISLFMRKLNGGYSRYFNKRHERTGALFQAKYKSFPITTEVHFIHLPYYIHLNPLDYKFPSWRERRINNATVAIQWLEKYPWSSHLDFSGQKNLPSLTQREFLLQVFGGTAGYRQSITTWLNSFDNLLISDIDRLEG